MLGTRTCRRSLRASAPRFVHPLVVRDEPDYRTLECRVDGYPKPDIRWEKNGKTVGKSRRIHMTRSGDVCLLQIKSYQIEDAGLYSCTATNSLGTATTQAKLDMQMAVGEKKMNGPAKQSLKPKRIMGFRSRSPERCKGEEEDPPPLTVLDECSRSTTQNARQNPQNSKSKLPHFSQMWRKNEDKVPALPAHKEEPAPSRRKELSKCTEDCRKNKKRFLNKVKIPDIFVGNKPDETVSRIKMNGELGTNGNSTQIDFVDTQINEGKHHPVKTRERIAAYLKRFENSSPKSKDPPIEFTGSLKHSVRNAVTEAERRHSAIGESESNFAKFGRFFRRKSSGSSRKSSDASENCNAALPSIDGSEEDETVEAVITDDNQSAVENTQTLPEINGHCNAALPSIDGSEEDETVEAVITDDNQSAVENTKTLPEINGHCNAALPSIDGSKEDKTAEAVITDDNQSAAENTQTLPEINGHSIFFEEIIGDENLRELVAEDDHTNDIPISSSIVLTNTCEERITNDFNTEEDNDDKELIKGFPLESHLIRHDDREEVEVAEDAAEDLRVTVNEDSCDSPGSQRRSSANHEEILVSTTAALESEASKAPEDIPEKVENVPNSAPTPNNLANLLHLRKHCKGKIRYSGDLIEEECEALFPEKPPFVETLDPDPQTVSSPQGCPARILKGPQSVTVLRGEAVTLAAGFDGHPPPKVVWMKGGRVLCGVGRLSILEGREMSVVTVNDVTADDSGKYVVSVENEGGGDSCFASVAVVGFPEPPGGEPTASEVTDHSLVLSWYGSMYDGGSVVTGYQVEMCCLPDRRWHKVASSVNTSCSAQGLSKGQRYVFRVRAENRYGASHPSKESKVICLDDFLQYDTSSEEEPEEEPSAEVKIESGAEYTERFDLKEEVGKGRFGTVYRCVEKSSGRPRAAKVIRCLKVKDKEKVRQEIDIMSRLHHPKLMQVLAAFESGRNMIMIMEFISGGELFERVIADDFVLTEQDCILFMRQICDGVAYLHRHRILHLDLKPENILCKTRTSHKIKIIDFGLARVYNADKNLRILFGTPEFVAPEVINYEPVCPASDMWSVGVICYVLLSGLSPFMGDSDTETFANITRGEMDFDDEAFDEISQDAKDFISRLLVKKLKSRMSAEECLRHPWLATSSLLQKRPLSTEKLKRFIIRRKWQKSGTAIRALGRMVSLSRSSLSSSCDSYSPLGSPTSSRSRSSLMSRSETTESGDSDVFHEPAR